MHRNCIGLVKSLSLLLLISFILSGCLLQNGEETNLVQVEEVVDGDTIKVIYHGELTTVRILNIDTPEVRGQKGEQLYGAEASNYAKKWLEGKKIRIEISAKDQPYDRYGRLLAYVFVDDRLYEEMIVREGLARVAYLFEPDLKYVDRLKKAEEQARKEKKNIWSIPGYVTEKGYDMSVVKEKAS
jgi:micrococcal nuclease